MEEVKSPLTGEMCRHSFSVSPIDHHKYTEENLGGAWFLTDYVLDNGFLVGGSYHDETIVLDEKQTEWMVALARSRVWVANKTKKKPILFLSQEGFDGLDEPNRLRSDDVKQVQLVTPRSLWQEFQSLSLADKATMTLSNLALEEKAVGEGVTFALRLDDYPGQFVEVSSLPAEKLKELTYAHGLLYACVGKEGLVVLHHLANRGLVNVEVAHGYSSTVFLTPEGYSAVDEVRKGEASSAKLGFLVCRFTDTMEDVYRKVYETAGSVPELSCQIRRVKDVDHVDRIDDRIMAMIEGATIVIVDLTDATGNFNVALEAGYAMALGKPIIWTMRKGKGKINLPFDIHTHNLMTWEMDAEGDLGDFQKRLRARMQAAIDKAERGKR